MRLILELFLAVTIFAWDAAAQEKSGKKVAFLVGINQYQKPRFRPLQFAQRDVEEVGKELKALDFEVTVLTGENATRKAIDETVNSLVRPLGSSDLMLVMLTGHGIQQDYSLSGGRRTNDAFYCPYDAIHGDPDTLLSLSYLIDKVLAPNVGRKLLLVDACRDEADDPGRGSRGIDGDVISLPTDTAVMFSCRNGQRSFEDDELKHGLFTYCVLEGIRGQAVSDGAVSWSDLTSYVNRRMASQNFSKYLKGRQQEPIPAGGVPFTVLGRIPQKVVAAKVISPIPQKVVAAKVTSPIPSRLMLDGYCPVTLWKNRRWVKGNTELNVEHRGQHYFLADEVALKEFKENPERYVPRFLGCDPTMVVDHDRAIKGDTRFTAFYADELYMFTAEENRKRFKASPDRYTRTRVVFEVNDIEIEPR